MKLKVCLAIAVFAISGLFATVNAEPIAFVTRCGKVIYSDSDHFKGVSRHEMRQFIDDLNDLNC